MAIVRYDKRILKRLKRHTLFIISPPPSMEQYNVTLQRVKEKITAFYTEIEKYLSDEAYGGRFVPYNIPNKEKYKYLVYTDIYSKVRWGVIYEDMGETRIIRILEQETFLASRFQIKENKVLISEADLLYMISESITRILREHYEDNPIFGWDYSKEWFLKGDADYKTIEKGDTMRLKVKEGALVSVCMWTQHHLKRYPLLIVFSKRQIVGNTFMRPLYLPLRKVLKKRQQGINGITTIRKVFPSQKGLSRNFNVPILHRADSLFKHI